jgi:hypothetical protein
VAVQPIQLKVISQHVNDISAGGDTPRTETENRGTLQHMVSLNLTFCSILKFGRLKCRLHSHSDGVGTKIKDIEPDEYALDEGITAMLQNELDEVPQGNDYSTNKEQEPTISCD